MFINKNHITYTLCPAQQVEENFLDTYNKIYKFWSSMWTDTYNLLGLTNPLYSDAFTRQSYIGTVMHEDQCIALCCFRWIDAKATNYRKDSYFKNWTEGNLNKICSRGTNLIICSHLTVHPEFRGKDLNISIKDIMCGLLVNTFLHSHADAMCGAVRVDRKVNSLTARWGSTEIAPNVDSGYGDKVDLIGFFKDNIDTNKFPAENSIVESIWQKRIIIPKYCIENETVFKKQNEFKIAS